MQPRSAQALQLQSHGSSGAQKQRHQDDNLFTQGIPAPKIVPSLTVTFDESLNTHNAERICVGAGLGPILVA